MKASCILLLSIIASVFSYQPGVGEPCLTSINPSTATFIVPESMPFYNPYPCALSETAFVSSAGQLDLTIAPSATTGYTCAKGWTTQKTGFGLYTCNIKAPGIAGTVTSCVAESSVDTPYENVYIKFFGDDIANVHVGFFTAGRVQQAGPIALNFNPTLGYHVYSFEVTTNYIKWYIDGVERSSEYGSRQLPVQLDQLTVSFVTEDGKTLTENSNYYTDPTTSRVFSPASPTAFFTASFQNISFAPQALSGCEGFNPQPAPNTAGFCSVISDLAIYTESPDNKWTITPTGATLTDETYQIHSGGHSMSFTILPGSTLTMTAPAPFTASDYYAIDMWINGGSYGNQQIFISAILDGNALTLPLSLTSLLVGMGGLTAGVWTHVVIPISSLGLAPTSIAQIYGFQFTFPGAANGGLDAGRTFFLDDIYLIQEYPMCANSTSFIYTDGLAEGVADQSWGGRRSLSSTSPVFSGQYAISWDMYAYDGLKFAFKNSYSTDVWQAIQFRVNLAKVTNRGWSIYFTSPDSTAENNRAGAAPLNLIQYYQGIYPPGTWPLVTIPLRQFGIGSGININSIVFACDSNDYQGTLALDDIAFISNQAAQEDPNKTSSATTIAYSSLFTLCAIISLYLL